MTGERRWVPVHPALVELGLIDYHKRMVAAGQKQLFPDIKPDSRGSWAGSYSGFYRCYITRIGVKSDKSLNFHSFRHGFADALRRAGLLDHEFAFLLGHTQNNVTGRYGAPHEGDLEKRVQILNCVEYPGLDLSGLKFSQAFFIPS